MNTQSNAFGDSPGAAQVAAPAAIPATKRLLWLVRRELWENRSLYLAPLAVAALFLLGFLLTVRHLPSQLAGLSTLDPMQQRMLVQQPYDLAALLVMGATFLVTIFYCLDALYGERRDRSILFWKSLPVSDLMTVLSKVTIPLVIIPLLTFGITLITQWSMLLISNAVLLAHGQSVAPLWNNLQLWSSSMGLLYHLLAIHGLWYAPIYCWLLLVSAWAKRAPFLWAFLPPLAIGVVGSHAFGSSYFFDLMRYRIAGDSDSAPFPASGGMSMHLMSQLHIGRFLIDPGLWSGLLVAAIFVALAIQLRRYRGPI